VDLSAEVTSRLEIVQQGWTVAAAPDSSIAEPNPATALQTSFTPDRVGDYRLVFEVTDRAHQTASCEVTIHSVVGPPVAICPDEELRTRALESIFIPAEAFDDDGVADYVWEVREAPPESNAVLIPTGAGPDGTLAGATFSADLPGRYVLELTVTDVDGETGSCEVVVIVVAPPIVECIPDELGVPTRQVTRVSAEVRDERGIASVRWEIVERPEGSVATLTPEDQIETEITPDRVGA
jgi:hypothetical protein